MSGGHFEYKDEYLNDIAEKIEYDIKYNDIIPDQDTWEGPCGNNFCEETMKFIKELPDLLRYLHEILYEYDYMVCCDSCEESFLKIIKELKMPSTKNIKKFYKKQTKQERKEGEINHG